MIRRPPRSTRRDTLCPYTTLFRSPSANILFAARPSEKVEGSTVSVFVSPTADATRGEGHRPEGSEYRRADFVVLNVASGTVAGTYPRSEERREGKEGVSTCRSGRWTVH